MARSQSPFRSWRSALVSMTEESAIFAAGARVAVASAVAVGGSAGVMYTTAGAARVGGAAGE